MKKKGEKKKGEKKKGEKKKGKKKKGKKEGKENREKGIPSLQVGPVQSPVQTHTPFVHVPPFSHFPAQTGGAIE
jgi:hypothetical protein